MEAYCVTLTKNVCYDAIRASHIEEDNRQPEELSIVQESDLFREIAVRDEVHQVRRIIGNLPKPQRQIIMMRDVNDCSMEEIEQATGLSAVNIRVMLSRTRKKIREQFNAIRNYECR
jgi:RNA polymerase sigma-70 factor (ECF subfamily)